MPMEIDVGKGDDKVNISQGISLADRMFEKAKWRIEKFHGDYKTEEEAYEAEGKPYEVLEFEGNVLLNEGIGEIEDTFSGLGTPTKFDNTNAYIGVGDGTAAAAATQTGLQGTNKTYKAMEASYPSRSGQEVTWKSVFGDSDGNHGWQEFTVANSGSDAGKNLNRKVSDKGTKSGGTWTIQLKITLS